MRPRIPLDSTRYDDRHGEDAAPAINADRTDARASGSVRALVIHPYSSKDRHRARTPQSCLDEAVGLAAAIDLEIVGTELVALGARRPATLFGKGVVSNLGHTARVLEAGLAIVDAPLSPAQQRNLERSWHCKVIDRTGLILEIFGDRARTKEGKLQVELAALSYQRSRLVRSWTHLERQRGGFGFLGGPGESQLEIDRRLILARIARIKSDLEQVMRTRALHRQARQRVPYPAVALVGYTNAGKSTLFNSLTQGQVVASDQLFATLDPTMRRLPLGEGREIILSDTVGFVSELPTDLVAAFRATLEEVTEADLIVHVRDVSHPDTEAQKSDVEAVLRSLGLEEERLTGMVEVLNKIDLLDGEARDRVRSQAARRPGTVALSALTGAGIADLRILLEERLSADDTAVHLSLPLSDGAGLAWLYDRGQVLEREDDEVSAHLVVRLSPADRARFEKRRAAATPSG